MRGGGGRAVGRWQRPGPARSMAAAAGPDEADEAVRGTCEDASVCKRYRSRAGPGRARRCHTAQSGAGQWGARRGLCRCLGAPGPAGGHARR